MLELAHSCTATMPAAATASAMSQASANCGVIS